MRTPTALAILLLLAALLATMFWWTMRVEPDASPALTETAREFTVSGAPERVDSPTISVATSTALGEYLVARNGMTLYAFSHDATNTSSCIEQCAVHWPPYNVSASEPLLAAEEIVTKLSTIARDDGSVQLTFEGKPLYFFKNDAHPGEFKGQGVNKVWYVVHP